MCTGGTQTPRIVASTNKDRGRRVTPSTVHGKGDPRRSTRIPGEESDRVESCNQGGGDLYYTTIAPRAATGDSSNLNIVDKYSAVVVNHDMKNNWGGAACKAWMAWGDKDPLGKREIGRSGRIGGSPRGIPDPSCSCVSKTTLPPRCHIGCSQVMHTSSDASEMHNGWSARPESACSTSGCLRGACRAKGAIPAKGSHCRTAAEAAQRAQRAICGGTNHNRIFSNITVGTATSSCSRRKLSGITTRTRDGSCSSSNRTSNAVCACLSIASASCFA